jgi:hypothetical protein
MQGGPFPPPYAPPPWQPRPADEADIFAASLPPVILKAAGICALVQGLLMLPFALRLALAISGETEEAATIDYYVGRGTVGIIIVVHIAVAIASVASMRMMSGRLWASILAIVVSPLCGLASLVGLLTGALAGLFGIFLAVVTLILAAVNIGNVRRIAHARETLERMAET